ncbi:TetR/AcrR family transcriptional regulator [Streptomyces populi]
MQKQGYHHGNLREALVEAGPALARTGGPGSVLLRAVSREAGVSHNAAYRHFSDHEALVAAVAERCMTELGTLMVQRLATVPEPSTRRGPPCTASAICSPTGLCAACPSRRSSSP